MDGVTHAPSLTDRILRATVSVQPDLDLTKTVHPARLMKSKPTEEKKSSSESLDALAKEVVFAKWFVVADMDRCTI